MNQAHFSSGPSPGWQLVKVREYLEARPGKHALVVTVAVAGPFVGLVFGDVGGFVAGAVLSAAGYFIGREVTIKVRDRETVASGTLDPEGLSLGVRVLSAQLERVEERGDVTEERAHNEVEDR